MQPVWSSEVRGKGRETNVPHLCIGRSSRKRIGKVECLGLNSLGNPQPLLTNGEGGEWGWGENGQTWPERMVWNKSVPGGSDQRLLGCQVVLGALSNEESGLLNLDLEVMESLFGLAEDRRPTARF